MIILLLLLNLAQAETGKILYSKNCIRCHNANPTKAGSIGPELFTTPGNVFHGKVTQGVYPAGYKPKRKTKIMPKFKFDKKQTDSIAQYIKAFK